MNFLVMPIFFLSGALYPIDGLPAVLRAVVLVNPMFYVVDTVRGLTIGVHHFPYALNISVIAGTAVILAVIATIRFRKMEP